MSNNKEFKISSWAIDKSVIIYFLIFVSLVLGISAYYAMPRENFPEIKEKKVYINTAYPGNTGEDIERLITVPLEKAFKTISNIDNMTSSSLEDYSIITVEFNQKVTLSEALTKIKDKIDVEKAKDEWPTFNGAKVSPSAFEINISEEIPIFNINLQGDYQVIELNKYAEYLQDIIENVSEIKEVNIRGVEPQEVQIAMDVYKMMASKVSFDDVINTIKAGNMSMSAGNIVSANQRKTIRITGEITNPKQLENFVVKNEKQSPIYLKDVAEITFREKDKTTYARAFGENVVMLDVKKSAGTNMIDATNKIKKILEDAKDNYLPKDLTLFISNDQSIKTINQVDDLVNNIIFGVILVVLVLTFFLGFRNALFVGVAIPLSMMISFIILNFLGYTLNTMVLFALVMGLGMLVDNGVVVVENVYRLMAEKGMSRIEATKKGIGEIAFPIIISTMTTVAAFLPLGFWPGVMGEFMMYFPITLSIVLGSSLFVALVMNSMLVSKFIKTQEKNITRKKLIKWTYILGISGVVMFVIGFVSIANSLLISILLMWLYKYKLKAAIDQFQKFFLTLTEEKYKSFLRFALKGKNPRKFLLGTVGLLILSFILLGISSPKVEFFPDNKPNQIIVYIEYPEGTDIKKTNSITKQIEQDVFKVLDDRQYKDGEDNFMVDSAITQVGKGSGNPFKEGNSGSRELPNKANITVLLVESKYRRGKDSEVLRKKVQEALHNKYAGVSISVEKNQEGPPAGQPINIEIKGDDYYELIKEAQKLVAFIDSKGVLGIENLTFDVNKDKLSNEIIIDRKKAGELGVSVYQIANQLRRSIFGEKAGIYKKNGEDYDINVRFNKNLRYDKSALYNQNLIFRDKLGKLREVPLRSLITIKDKNTFSNIKHRNSQKLVTVQSSVLAGYNANEVVDHIKKFMPYFKFPKGITYKFTGQIEEQGKQMSFLLSALGIGMMLILLLLIIQFNSISKPMIILLAILLSFIGVLLGLIVFNMTFVIIMTMLGIISLAGIVVNNAVVLLDYTDLLIKEKRKELKLNSSTQMLSLEDIKNAIIEGGKSRLRPVLLTAITTVLGLVPLAIGMNIDFMSFLASYNPKIYIGGDNMVFWGPLAWTVIFGLLFATFLTLVIVPVCNLIAIKMKMKLLKRQ